MLNSELKKAVSSKDSVKRMCEMLKAVQIVHQVLYDGISSVTTEVKNLKFTNEQLADVGYFFRELETVFDECRKEVKARKELVSKVLAFKVAQNCIQDPTADPIVRGNFARACTDVKIRPKLPKKDSAEYRSALEFFDVPESVIQNGVLKLDWKTVSELLTSLMEQGKKLPDGLTETYPEYTCTFMRTRKNYDE